MKLKTIIWWIVAACLVVGSAFLGVSLTGYIFGGAIFMAIVVLIVIGIQALMARSKQRR